MRVGEGSKCWSEAAAWSGDGIRREVFFFESRGVELYGSLYAAPEPVRPYGLLACGSWGVEGTRTEPLRRAAALAMARLGGAAMVFHYPGHGDSFGDPAGVALADLGAAAADAATAADRRLPDLRWIFAGFMFGAAAACLALREREAGSLLLVQPALRPGAYFHDIEERAGPLAPSRATREPLQPGSSSGMLYGYPVPRRIARRGGEADGAVATALAEFEGSGAVIRHHSPRVADLAPRRFERIEVPGHWRFAAQNSPALATATEEWLDRYTAAAIR